MTRLKVIAPSGKPGPPLTSVGVTQAAAKAVFPAKAGIQESPEFSADTGHRPPPVRRGPLWPKGRLPGRSPYLLVKTAVSGIANFLKFN